MTALAQSANGSSGGTNIITITLPNSITAGNTLIAGIPLPTGVHVVSVTDSSNDPWIRAGNASSTGGDGEIWMARGVYPIVISGSSGGLPYMGIGFLGAGMLGAGLLGMGGGVATLPITLPTTVTITLSANVTADANVSEWSGLLTSAPLDTWSANFGTSSNPIGQMLTPRMGGELFYGVASGSSAITSVLNSYTALPLPGDMPGAGVAYAIDNGTLYDNAVTALSPVGYWPLTDAVGTRVATDASGHGHGASVVNGTQVAFGVAGPVGNQTAAIFSGGNGYLTAGSVATSGSVSVVAWSNTTSTTDVTIIEKGFGYQLLINDGVVLFEVGGSTVTGPAFPLDGNWHMIAATCDHSGNVVFYLDGQVASTGFAFFASFTNSGYPTLIGITELSFLPYVGELAQVAVFQGVLTAAQVANLYSLRRSALPAEWATSGSGTWSVVQAAFVPSNGPVMVNARLQFPEVLVQMETLPNYLADIQGLGVWTDISSYVRQMTLGPIGRQHELDRVQASQASLTVNNRDGSFNPFNSLSFLWNNGYGLKPQNGVKVTAAWNGITSKEYYGYLQSIVPSISDVLNVDATLSAYDLLEVLSLAYLANNNLGQAVLADAAVAYYRLGDAISSQRVNDSAGSNIGSLIGAPAFGAAGQMLTDTDTSLDTTGGSNTSPMGGFRTVDTLTQPPTVHNPVTSVSHWTFECWAKWTGSTTPAPAIPAMGTAASVAAIPNAVLLEGIATGDTPSTTLFELQVGYLTTGGNTYFDQLIFVDSASVVGWQNQKQQLPVNLLDGDWHHIVFASNGIALSNLFLDGQFAFITGTPLGPITNLTVATPSGLGLDPSASSVAAVGWTGIIDEVAFYNTTLTGTQIENHYNIGKWFQTEEFGASVGGTTAGRFNKVMAVAGLDSNIMLDVPYPFRTEMYAETNPLTTTSALNYLQTQSETEPGLIFQGPDGHLKAYNRQYQYLNPTSVTSQGIIGDSEGVTLHYDGPSLQITQDDLDTWTTIQVQSGRQGAQLQEWGPAQSATAAQSASVYGSRTMQGLTSLQMLNDPDALAIAQNYAAWYNVPLNRVTQITLNSQGGGGANIPLMLSAGLMDRLTIQYQGQTPGPQFSQDSLIEQITHTVDMNNPTWTTSYAMSPYEIRVTSFIFGSSNQLSGAASVTGSGTSWTVLAPSNPYASGTITFTIASGATTTVAYNGTASTVQTALATLVPGTTVTGGPLPTGNLTVTFGTSQASFSAYFTSGDRLML